MSSHFLLSAAARTISLRQVYAGGEEKAFELFKKLRWPETMASRFARAAARSKATTSPLAASTSAKLAATNSP